MNAQALPTPAAEATTQPRSSASGPPRQAASLIVVRDAPRGLEVLMLKRVDKPGDQNSGATVFPGGLLDKADSGHAELCMGLDDSAISARLCVAEGGLNYWIAAVRECFEEAGLLFALDAQARPVDLNRRDPAELKALRHSLHTNETNMAQVCTALGVRLAVDQLAYYSHWVTPLGMPKIFDTRFFIALAPDAQTARHDATETVDLMWLTPAEALDPARGLKLMNVTSETLRELSQHASAQAAISAARAQTKVPMIRPRIALSAKGKRPIMPRDWAYAEAGRLDPLGQGTTAMELTPGAAVWLSPRVCRVTAGNGSLMTGPGTNAYFIGAPGGDDWALLDPGPADAAHVQALIAAAPGKVTRILVTHTHKDHSPAAAALKAATGAPTFGRLADHPEWQDSDFHPDQVLGDGQRLQLGEGVTLRVIHTPGHASNHLCYLLEEEKLLFTGDHLMQGSTVVINPPDGDMAVYLASLRRLLDVELDWLAPGHGFLIDQPHAVVHKTIAHRLAREGKVLAAVRAASGADGSAEAAAVDEATLLAVVYADTPKALHAVALRSLRAHLIKLRDDGAVRSEPDGRWRAS